MRNKHRLRGLPHARNVFIDEDLTIIRAQVVRELRKEDYKVTTHDGKISARKVGSEDIYVDYPQDFLRLPWDEEKFKQFGINPDF